MFINSDGAYAAEIKVASKSAFIGGHVASDAPLALEENSTLSSHQVSLMLNQCVGNVVNHLIFH